MPAFHEALLAQAITPDFDDVAGDTVLKDLDSLRSRDTSRKQFNEVPGTQNCGRVPAFATCLNSHRTFDQVKCTGDAPLGELFAHQGPNFLQVLLSISRMALLAKGIDTGEGGALREEGGEATLF